MGQKHDYIYTEKIVNHIETHRDQSNLLSFDLVWSQSYTPYLHLDVKFLQNKPHELIFTKNITQLDYSGFLAMPRRRKHGKQMQYLRFRAKHRLTIDPLAFKPIIYLKFREEQGLTINTQTHTLPLYETTLRGTKSRRLYYKAPVMAKFVNEVDASQQNPFTVKYGDFFDSRNSADPFLHDCMCACEDDYEHLPVKRTTKSWRLRCRCYVDW
jgi:hypothetical protein